LNWAAGSSEYAVDKTEAERRAIFEANKANAIDFWRAMGFRRVGVTHWFCYAMDPTHPARRTAVEDDFDP
jgi:hypothetical protein